MIDRRYMPEELRAVITQAEGLIGDNLDDLVRRYQLGASWPGAEPGRVSRPHSEFSRSRTLLSSCTAATPSAGYSWEGSEPRSPVLAVWRRLQESSIACTVFAEVHQIELGSGGISVRHRPTA
jgi:hypothetical protein